MNKSIPERNYAADSYVDTLRAIKARIDGDFDNASLLKCGPLTTDTLEDVVRFVDDCLFATRGDR